MILRRLFSMRTLSKIHQNPYRESQQFSRLFSTSQLRKAPRLNPQLWYNQNYIAFPNANQCPPMLAQLKALMGVRYTPRLQHVEVLDIEGQNVSEIRFHTINSPINIFSPDFIDKLLQVLPEQSNLSFYKTIRFVSNNPYSFFHRDDYDLIEKMTFEEYNLYSEIVFNIITITPNISTPVGRVEAFVNGPCMDSGYSIMHASRQINCTNSSNTCFGFRGFEKSGVYPAGLGPYFFATSTNAAMAGYVLKDGGLLTPSQHGRLFNFNVSVDREDISTNQRDYVMDNFDSKVHKLYEYMGTADEAAQNNSRFNVGHTYQITFPHLYHFNRSRLINLRDYLLSFMAPVYLWAIFQKKYLLTRRDKAWIRFLFLHWIKLYNSLYAIIRSLKHQDKFIKQEYKEETLQYTRKATQKEKQIFDSLPHYKSTLRNSYAIFGEGLLPGLMLYQNFVKDFNYKMDFYTYEKNEYLNNKSNLEYLTIFCPSTRDYFNRGWTNKVICPKNSKELRKKQFLKHNTLHYEKPKIITQDIIFHHGAENLQSKQSALSSIQQFTSGDQIVLINNLSNSLKEIIKNAKAPQNVYGVNFGFPFYDFEYVEICCLDPLQKNISKVLSATYFNQFRYVIMVKDSPGGFAPRVFLAGFEEYLLALLDGCPMRFLDIRMKQYGFTHNFSRTADSIGIDKLLDCIKNLSDIFPKYNTSILEILVSQNAIGSKSNMGFLNYKSFSDFFKLGTMPPSLQLKSAIKKNKNFGYTLSADKYLERIKLRMLNEIIKCLDEGVVSSTEAADVAAIHGTGFPDNLLGPFGYIDKVGISNVVYLMEKNYKKTGRDTFIPSKFLTEWKELNQKFYRD